MNGSNGMAIFLAGISLGVLLGIFFASYLVKLNRGGARKGGDLAQHVREYENQTVYYKDDQVVVKR